MWPGRGPTPHASPGSQGPPRPSRHQTEGTPRRGRPAGSLAEWRREDILWAGPGPPKASCLMRALAGPHPLSILLPVAVQAWAHYSASLSLVCKVARPPPQAEILRGPLKGPTPSQTGWAGLGVSGGGTQGPGALANLATGTLRGGPGWGLHARTPHRRGHSNISALHSRAWTRPVEPVPLPLSQKSPPACGREGFKADGWAIFCLREG